MPAVATCPSVPTSLTSTGFGSEFHSEPQGEAGRILIFNAEAVDHQWNERAEILNASIDLAIAGADSGTEPYDSVPPYVSLPLKPAFYAKVRYKYVGKMKSVPYPLDD